jgi:MFS transporter, DHA1 family, multidrug resistance protein
MTEIQNPSTLRRRLFILVSLIALGPLCTDMYLPALPELVRYFDSDVPTVQFTLSAYLFGFGLSQLFYGSAADHFGRRPVLLFGMGVFLLSTFGCALAQSMPMLILFRLLQAIGVGAGSVICRAIVRDLYGPSDSARIFSYMSSAVAVAPVIAPVVGGFLTTWFSWRAVFWFLAATGTAATLGFYRGIPESVPRTGTTAFNFATLVRNKQFLLRDSRFIGYVLCFTFVFTGLFTYVSSSAHVLIGFMGVKTEHFGFYFGLPVFGFIFGTQTGARLHYRASNHRLIGAGIALVIAGSLLMLVFALIGSRNPYSVVLPQMVYLFGAGMTQPRVLSSAMAPHPHIAATASSLMGFIQITFASVVVAALGYVQGESAVPMALTMCVTSALTLLAFRKLVLEGGSAPRD